MTSVLSFRSKFSLVGAIMLLAFSALPFAQEKAGAPDRVDKVSNKDFSATVRAAETVLQKNGFMIIATIDHQNMLTSVGAKIKGATAIEFGKPDMGKMLLPMAPEAGLEFPGRFYIWERSDGKTVVSYRRPSSGMSQYGNEMLTKMGRDMDQMWSMFAEEAAK